MEEKIFQTGSHKVSSSSCFSSSLMIGDYIGMESSVDLVAPSDPEECRGGDETPETCEYGQCRRWRNRGSPPRTGVVGKREFPPPIPSLARTENLSSHMPWVMRRYYSGDGRLVIREERVRHHEYFTAHRSNGRLTLRLVPLDDAPWIPPSADLDESPQDCGRSPDDETSVPGESAAGESSSESDEDPVFSPETPPSTEEGGGGVAIAAASAGCGAGGGKCYDGMGSSGCIFRMPVLPLRPVHS